MSNFIWDDQRAARTGIAETVLCDGKNSDDLIQIIKYHCGRKEPVLLTRLSDASWSAIPAELKKALLYNADARTAIINPSKKESKKAGIGIVCAGTSDISIAREAQETLCFYGYEAPIIADVGVAGLWRLMSKLEELKRHDLLIAVAGMEGALFSVLPGLVSAPVIAVPSSIGYGVNAGGVNALNSALGSCAPGVVTVNIDNGYGAAIAAIKMMKLRER